MSDSAQHASPVSIGFDIGGTNLRASVVDRAGRVVDTLQEKSRRDAECMEHLIVEMTRSLQNRHQVGAVGVAVAGFLDPTCSIVQFAPHLPWRDAPLKSRLQEHLDVPVVLEHDANSAAYGEFRYGAAVGAKTWALCAIGTGIGATLMHNGEIFRGAYGIAPELGHLPVVPNGRPCACGKRGCLERYCSGTALAFGARELLESDPGTSSPLRDKPEFTGEDVMRAARAGDELALRAMGDFSDWLSIALSMVGDIFDPELIVVGGGVSANADLFLSAATQKAQKLVVGAGHRPQPLVKVAELGGDAGMIGVATLAASAAGLW
ncbi:ROK family protein [Corynebacterium epidermidicanis]|uniref:Transcriptional regulator/sugar kinase n=1 Tax=Corynebacterium epidermidicanis TaxID=1050174 RepID=A0A0G3GVG7_9CORY|nr:ROK family protein [Corynebacterium epidermidicanis]AKK03543.1 transcriptional regulator/sugar kinase [Corynebacterium epidermidicanis]